ncbi:MAG: redoxin family protein [Planctomycetes bacterium]|nr:redoxin family protein [Planctomycetota bacterium]
MRFALLLVASAVLLPVPAQEPSSVPLGASVEATFTDLRWQTRRLGDLGPAPATVLYFASLECPIVQRQLPRLGALAQDLAPAGVAVLVVNVGPGDGLVEAAGQVTSAAPAAVFAKDFDLALARACGVDRTGTAVVLDAAHRIVYRGRVDDQHGYTGARAEPSRHDLRSAVDDVVAGRPVVVPATEVSGCRITAPPTAADGPVPTFAGAVAAILQRHCQECHRPGGEAPFPLLTQAQANRHAAMIAEVVEQGRMPPWYGTAVGGPFANHRGLSAEERAAVVRWARGGMPGGDPATSPPPRPLPTSEWRIGEPDLVVELKAPVRLPADGIVPYKYFVLPHRFDQDTWVEAIEIRPSNERALHHCNLARVKFGEDFSQDGFVTGYVPGGDPLDLDPGSAVRIPAGSALALQAHYVTTGEPTTDRLRVGFRFPRVPVQREMQVTIVANQRFEIPPGARAHPVRASRKLPDDAEGIGMFVHMHVRGRDMSVTATLPSGDEQRLLVVPNYNFDWQQSYRWPRGERSFPRGTRFTALAHFDNSPWNPFNPDPAQAVRFGLQTEDEMMYLFVFWLPQRQALGLEVDPRTGHAVPTAPR